MQRADPRYASDRGLRLPVRERHASPLLIAYPEAEVYELDDAGHRTDPVPQAKKLPTVPQLPRGAREIPATTVLRVTRRAVGAGPSGNRYPEVGVS